VIGTVSMSPSLFWIVMVRAFIFKALTFPVNRDHSTSAATVYFTRSASAIMPAITHATRNIR
jgi:hypothetical protein